MAMLDRTVVDRGTPNLFATMAADVNGERPVVTIRCAC